MSTMHATSFAMIYACTLGQATYLAELCGVDKNLIYAPWQSDLYKLAAGHGRSPNDAKYYGWEDRQTAGGGIRIDWMPVSSMPEGGLMWIGCHSGYPTVDMTDDAAEFATQLGYRPVGYGEVNQRNPRIYPER